MTNSTQHIAHSEIDEGIESYFKEIKHYPLLSFEEELELSRRIKSGDVSARQRLIEGNLRLVIKIARQYQTPGIGFLDLIQEGNLGLITAAEKYDFNKEVRFCTYASWWIKQAITRAIANKRRPIRLPHRKEDALKRLKNAYNQLSQSLMRNPSLEELAHETQMELEDVVTIMNIGATPMSLDAELGADQGTMHEICQDFTYSPEEILNRKLVSEEINDLLHSLEERERVVLTYRYALTGQDKLTLKTISEKMGVSPETVRQIEMRAIRKMQNLGVGENA